MNFFLRFFISLIFLISHTDAFTQNGSVEKLGLRNFDFKYKNEVVNILIKSKEGDEDVVKPLIIYFQGSLARPLVINYPQDNNYKYSIAFPFSTEKIIEKYHIAVISKPFIPVIADITHLDESYSYIDSITKNNPINFLENNNLEYYTKRNVKAIKFLKKLNFIDKTSIILLGHSEGSNIAYEVAKRCHNVTHLIYLSGNPFGRYMNISQRSRKSQDSISFLDMDTTFDFWVEILRNKKVSNFQDGGDTYKSWFIYSKPYFKSFLKIKKPVFIGYGTKDDSSPYNDLFYFYVLLKERKNFHIIPYIGLDHSFYKVNDNNTVNHEVSYWDVVVSDFLEWLK